MTFCLKLLFLPIANKSYQSMAKMKAVQPEMASIRERYGDDKMKQQQAMMELYKKEKINPVAGCWPVLIQIPVFFALYKVLFITIEMRHAPFFGWIQDLAAPDPTSILNLFGLLPFAAPDFVHLGIWPIIMGITMFIQMKMNPAPPDPVQAQIFTFMPIVFTFMLGSFPAGLVIYWAWNNTLSVIQQYVIMRRNGVKVELWDNLSGHVPAQTRRQERRRQELSCQELNPARPNRAGPTSGHGARHPNRSSPFPDGEDRPVSGVSAREGGGCAPSSGAARCPKPKTMPPCWRPDACCSRARPTSSPRHRTCPPCRR